MPKKRPAAMKFEKALRMNEEQHEEFRELMKILTAEYKDLSDNKAINRCLSMCLMSLKAKRLTPDHVVKGKLPE